MDDTAVNIIELEAALAKFDHARDDFMDAYASAPDESLGYKPEGDDYTIGYLLPHVEYVLLRYTALLAQIRETHWADITGQFPVPPPTDIAVNRAEALASIERAHDTLAGKLNELSTDEFNRKANVIYPDDPNPFPTSPADIITWVTEHYYEHVAHVGQLVEGWRAEGLRTK